MTVIAFWRGFLDSLDTPGGHIVVFVGLLSLGLHLGSMELQAGAMGALLRGVGNPSRKDPA